MVIPSVFLSFPPTFWQVQHDNPDYSRGIRQRLANASRDGDWFNKHKIVVGE
jgi:hypothetical protein